MSHDRYGDFYVKGKDVSSLGEEVFSMGRLERKLDDDGIWCLMRLRIRRSRILEMFLIGK